MEVLVAAVFVGFLISVVLVAACRQLAWRFGYTARPRDDRWHHRPTALLGGVAIAMTVMGLAASFVGAAALPVLLAGGGLMFAVGLVDDLISLKPYTKLVAEIVIASLFVFFGYRLAWTESLTLDTVLTLVWIVGLTNAFNLLDNMDGLCAGISLIAGTTLLTTVVLQGGVTPEATYLALLLGATAGFLVYNFHPASIFMGDSGSLFIGLNLAVLSLSAGQAGESSSNLLSMIVGPVLVLLVPIFDTTLVTVSRLLSGRSAAQGGRDHSSHRLVAIGLSERRAVAVLWTLSALGGFLALAIHRFQNDDWSSIAVAIFVLAMIIFAVYLSHVRVYETVDEALLRTGRITPFVINFMYKRRVAEVILDVCIVTIAYYSAYRLRFEGPEFSTFFRSFLESLPIVVGVQMVALFAVGAYRGVWRHFSLMDGVVFSKAVLFGTLSSVFFVVYLYRFENYSRGVFVIYGALLLLLLGGSRASFRLISEFAQRRRHEGQRLIIYGAGDGAVTVRELLARAPDNYRLLGFVDDDPSLARRRVQGYPVLGDYTSLVSLITNGAVDSVVISTALIDVTRLEELQALCGAHQVSLARVHFKLDQLVAS